MKIIRVLRVEDTRQWEEGPDDRWYPIPGSGIENSCGRCGRTHVVHATVEIDIDGTIGQMIVGTGCMKADEAEIASQIQSVMSAQKTLAKHERALVKYERLAAECKRIYAAVEAMPLPAIEPAKWNLVVGSKREIVGFKLGDAYISSDQSSPTQTEREALEYTWRLNRAKNLGMTHQISNAPHSAGATRKQIVKIKKKIEEKLHGSGSSTAGA